MVGAFFDLHWGFALFPSGAQISVQRLHFPGFVFGVKVGVGLLRDLNTGVAHLVPGRVRHHRRTDGHAAGHGAAGV